MGAAAKTSIELGARHAEVVHSAIKQWVHAGAITEHQASLLANTIEVQVFNWEKFAKYTLRLSVLCLVVAVSSIVFETRFVQIYRRIIALPAWLRSAITAVIATGVHALAYERSKRLPEQKYANEAIHGVGALVFALAALQLLEQLQKWFHAAEQKDADDSSHPKSEKDDDEQRRRTREREVKARQRFERTVFHGVAFGLASVYATVGLLSGSNLIWSCAMVVLGSCFGGICGYASGMYWLDVDSPLIFLMFGSILIAAGHLMSLSAITAPLWSTTRIWGMLYFFISLWIMSIFGYDDYFEAPPSRSRILSPVIRLFLWSFVFFVAAGVSIWHGLRFDDSTTKGFGLTFLGINMYTKYFECFWGWSKPLFFAGLAGTFVVVGRYAEDVWNMRLVRA